MIGYPDSWDTYNDVLVSDKTFFDNHVTLAKRAFKASFTVLLKPVDKKRWQMTPPTVNAYYDPTLNSINFPAGILKAPFFDAGFPAAGMTPDVYIHIIYLVSERGPFNSLVCICNCFIN